MSCEHTNIPQATACARTRMRLAAVLILALPLALAACGKKGSLRLPEQAPPAATSTAPAAVPDAEDEAE